MHYLSWNGQYPNLKLPKASSTELSRHHVVLPEGRSVAFAEAGEGPAVVLIHGTIVTLEDLWLGLADSLADRYRVIAVDRPGHGESQRVRLVDASPWRQAEILHDAMRAMGVSKPLIVGHSSGGAVALAYAMQFPDATAGVLALAPICFPEPRLEQLIFGSYSSLLSGNMLAHSVGRLRDPLLLPVLWRGMFLPQVMPELFRTKFPFHLVKRPESLVVEGDDALALGPGLLQSAMRYATCGAPVRVLVGGADLVLNNWYHGQVAAQMIPRASFHVLPGVGHMIHHVRADLVGANLDEMYLHSRQ